MKNNRFILTVLVSAAVSLSISSCEKHEDSGTEAPTVTITLPAEGQMVMGPNVHLQATVQASSSEHSELLHEVSVEVTKVSDNTVVFSKGYSTHELEFFAVDTTFTYADTGHTEMMLKVEAENHIPKNTTKTLSFAVHN